MARRVAAVDGAVDRSAVVAARQRHDALELVRHRVAAWRSSPLQWWPTPFCPTAKLAPLGAEHADERGVFCTLPKGLCPKDQRRNLHSGRNTRTNAEAIRGPTA
eukprot:scaffold21353_cov55-Phaeocystis_antarctica.AAC.1